MWEVASQNFSVIGVMVDPHRSLVDLGEATVPEVQGARCVRYGTSRST